VNGRTWLWLGWVVPSHLRNWPSRCWVGPESGRCCPKVWFESWTCIFSQPSQRLLGQDFEHCLSWSFHSDRPLLPHAWRLFFLTESNRRGVLGGILRDVADETLFPDLCSLPQNKRSVMWYHHWIVCLIRVLLASLEACSRRREGSSSEGSFTFVRKPLQSFLWCLLGSGVSNETLLTDVLWRCVLEICSDKMEGLDYQFLFLKMQT